MTKNKIFLDCGANLGQAFDEFSQSYPLAEYDYWLFEPNPACYKVLLDKHLGTPKVSVIWAAVHNQTGWANLSYRTEYDVGASIITGHNSGFAQIETNSSVLVPTIDLDTVVSVLYSRNYEIYLKLDIESSEYDILEKMIESNNLSKIHTLWCEFHSQYMNDETKFLFQYREMNILSHIQKVNLNFHLWR
jgi:FkbM family methyltransferase